MNSTQGPGADEENVKDGTISDELSGTRRCLVPTTLYAFRKATQRKMDKTLDPGENK
jgi:hypothetical protein